jgi:hypothetical protein
MLQKQQQKMGKEIREYSPQFERHTEKGPIYINDNAIEIVNRGNTIAYLGDNPLEPNEFIRTPFTKPKNMCVWRFYLKFGTENVLGDGETAKNMLTITRTNFHGNKFSNYKPEK